MKSRYHQCFMLCIIVLVCTVQAASAAQASLNTPPLPPTFPGPSGQPDTQEQVSSVTHSQPYTIWGYVKDTNGNPVSSATVSIGSLGLSSGTNSDGYYQVSGIGFTTGASYIASASKSGYGLSEGYFTVNGGDSHVDFTVAAPAPSPTPVVAQSSAPVTSVMTTPGPAPAQQPTPSPTLHPAGQMVNTATTTETISMDAMYRQPSATPTSIPATVTASTSAGIKSGTDQIAASAIPAMNITAKNDSLLNSALNNSSRIAQDRDRQMSIANMAENWISRLFAWFK